MESSGCLLSRGVYGSSFRHSWRELCRFECRQVRIRANLQSVFSMCFHDLAACFPLLGGIHISFVYLYSYTGIYSRYYNSFTGGHTKVLMSFIRRTDIKTGGHIWDRDVFQIHISDFRPFLRRLGHYLGQHLWSL